MSDNEKLPAPAVEDRLLGIMADQQTEIENFRNNVFGRLLELERKAARSKPADLFALLDFENLFTFALLAIAGVIALKIALGFFAARAAKEGTL